MTVKVGSARSSFGNTRPGDQNGGKEVSTQDWYRHSKGWVVIRAKSATERERIASAMEKACDNNDIGYSQGTRLALYENVRPYNYDPSKTTKPVNCDCSSLVRVCSCHAGIPVGNFITSSEARYLMRTGRYVKFTDSKHCRYPDNLLRGDILVTESKGHTVVVLTNGEKASEEDGYAPDPTPELGDRILRNGDRGEDVRDLQVALISLDYSCGQWGADGDFGDSTEMALRAFQTDKGLLVDGEYGPDSHKALMAEIDGDGELPSDPKKVQIQGGDCWCRTEPNTKGAKLGVAHRGDTYEFLLEISPDGWYKIRFKGEIGWVSGRYGKLV